MRFEECCVYEVLGLNVPKWVFSSRQALDAVEWFSRFAQTYLLWLQGGRRFEL